MLRRVSGLLLTGVAILIVEILARKSIRIPNLGVVFLATVLYSTFVGGATGGIVSGVSALVYYAYYESLPGKPFHYTGADLERVLTTTFVTVTAVVLLNHLHRRIALSLSQERASRTEADAARKRVTTILESITDGFFALDKEWRYTYVNRRAEELVKVPRDQLLGQVVWKMFPPLVGSDWDREYHRAMSKQVTAHFESYYPPLAAWFDTRAYPSRSGLTIYLSDITERKQAEQALPARLRQQAAVARLGQLALDGVELPALLNTAVERVASALAVETAKVLELLPGGKSLLLRAGVGWKEGAVGHAIVDAGADSQAGYTLLAGEPVICEDLRTEIRFHAPPLLVEHGLVSGVSVSIRGREEAYGVLGAHTASPRRFTVDDVNFVHAVANVLAATIEHRAADRKLRQSEATLRQVAENIREVFWMGDIQESEILYVSPAYEDIWGRSCESLYAAPRSWLDAVHPEDRGRVEAVCRDPRRFDAATEYRVVRPEGTVRWVLSRLFPVVTTHDRIVGIVKDITERKEAEESARRLEQERAARAAAEVGVQARDEVLAFVSHDLRNPLNTIQIAAALVERSCLAPGAKRQIDVLRRAVERMNRLIEDLLDVTRIEAGRMSLIPARIDVRALLAEAREALAGQAAGRSLRVDLDIADSPQVYADHDRVLQVLMNLAGNAIKFTPSGGRIVLGAAALDGEVRFSVSDTGPGIPPEQLPRLWDPFWQARRGDRRGVGLGLAIVRGIVQAHGGRVWAESAVGGGSTFRFTLRAAGAVGVGY